MLKSHVLRIESSLAELALALITLEIIRMCVAHVTHSLEFRIESFAANFTECELSRGMIF